MQPIGTHTKTEKHARPDPNLRLPEPKPGVSFVNLGLLQAPEQHFQFGVAYRFQVFEFVYRAGGIGDHPGFVCEVEVFVQRGNDDPDLPAQWQLVEPAAVQVLVVAALAVKE